MQKRDKYAPKTDPALRAAMYENRLGLVPLVKEIVDNAALAETLNLLKGNFLLCDTFEKDERTYNLRGYSPDFRQLELGEKPPIYFARLAKLKSGSHKIKFCDPDDIPDKANLLPQF